MKRNFSTEFAQPEDSNGYLFWQISMSWQKMVNRELEKIYLTYTQYLLLAALGWLLSQQEIVTQVDLCNHAKIDRMTASKVLRTLQSKKLLDRVEHETDTRAKSVTLTVAGKKLLQNAATIVNAADKDFFNFLNCKKGLLHEQMRQLWINIQ